MATQFITAQGSLSNKAQFIPEGILNSGGLSKTSEASTCFIQQKFSNKLQVYLINYVMSVSSEYSLYV